MQGINPRDPRPQEAAIGEPLPGEGVQIDVAEDEARQDEEEFDAQIALGRQVRQEADVQIGPEGVEHDPQGRHEPQGGQRTKIDGRLGHAATMG
ncbi:hypothetical protein D3C81_2024070 [compost metagenome]